MEYGDAFSGGAESPGRRVSDVMTTISVHFSVLAQVRNLLIVMEEDLGLAHLNRVERDLYHACLDISSDDGTFVSSEVRSHRLMVDVAPATFHRALKRLLETGIIQRADNSAVKNYILIHR